MFSFVLSQMNMNILGVKKKMLMLQEEQQYWQAERKHFEEKDMLEIKSYKSLILKNGYK